MKGTSSGEPDPRGRPLSESDAVLLRLLRSGASQARIAELLGTSEPALERRLQQLAVWLGHKT